MTTYRHAAVNDVKVFYREAGAKASPAVLLLHGFLGWSGYLTRKNSTQGGDR